jgi:hypothetical protein
MYKKGMIKVKSVELIDLMRVNEFHLLKKDAKDRIITQLERQAMVKESINVLTMDQLAEAMK